MQFQSFLEDPQYKDQHELQATMIRTFGKVAPHAEPHFRDEGSVEGNNLFNLKRTRGKRHRTSTRLGNQSVGIKHQLYIEYLGSFVSQA